MTQDVSLFLSPAEMMVVWNSLMEQPGKATYGILRKMQKQMVDQKLIADDGLANAPKGEPTE